MIPDLHDRPTARGPFLHALVSAPASHRAIDETLSDWRAETGQASSGLARLVCHLRYGLAMVRVLLLSLPREVGAVPFGPLSMRFAFVALIAAVATNVYPVNQAWSYRFLVTFSGALWPPYLLTILATRSLLAFLPLVWFYTAAWPAREPMSRTGLCVTMGISAVLVTALMGFEMDGLPSLITGQRRMTPGGVLGQIGRPILTVNFVQFDLAWVVGLGLLGTTVGTSSRAARWGWRLGLPAASAAVVFGFPWLPIASASIIGRLIGLSIWAVALWRLVRQGTSEPQPAS